MGLGRVLDLVIEWQNTEELVEGHLEILSMEELQELQAKDQSGLCQSSSVDDQKILDAISSVDLRYAC